MHYAFSKNHSVIKALPFRQRGDDERLGRERERGRGKAREQIHSTGLFISEKKQKLTGETMSLLMQRYSIFVSHDRLINHGNGSQGRFAEPLEIGGLNKR